MHTICPGTTSSLSSAHVASAILNCISHIGLTNMLMCLTHSLLFALQHPCLLHGCHEKLLLSPLINKETKTNQEQQQLNVLPGQTEGLSKP